MNRKPDNSYMGHPIANSNVLNKSHDPAKENFASYQSPSKPKAKFQAPPRTPFREIGGGTRRLSLKGDSISGKYDSPQRQIRRIPSINTDSPVQLHPRRAAGGIGSPIACSTTNANHADFTIPIASSTLIPAAVDNSAKREPTHHLSSRNIGPIKPKIGSTLRPAENHLNTISENETAIFNVSVASSTLLMTPKPSSTLKPTVGKNTDTLRPAQNHLNTISENDTTIFNVPVASSTLLMTPKPSSTLKPAVGTKTETKASNFPTPMASSTLKSDETNKAITDFDIVKILGKSAFGSVCLAYEKSSKSLVALRVLTKNQITAKNRIHKLLYAIALQYGLYHPNILSQMGYFHDSRHAYIILEYAARGTLSNMIRRQPLKRLPEETSARFVQSLANGLLYLQKRHIIHREIKAKNLLIGHDGQIKISDFDAATVGERQPYYDLMDMWSLGVLCYQMLVGKLPFRCSRDNMYFHVLAADYHVPDFVSRAANALIADLLVVKQAHGRCHLRDVRKHAWIKLFHESD